MLFNTIPEGIDAIRQGEILVVVDDPDRENEGDLVMAAEKATPKAINFMAKYGRGMICLPATSQRLKELELFEMVSDNTSKMSTAFTVTIDAKEVKTEVATIWGDYFKEPQISKYPEIHGLVHSIMQLASKCKQENIRENGVELLKNINKFTEIFWSTKEIKTEKKFSPYPPELVIVCPILKSA